MAATKNRCSQRVYGHIIKDVDQLDHNFVDDKRVTGDLGFDTGFGGDACCAVG